LPSASFRATMPQLCRISRHHLNPAMKRHITQATYVKIGCFWTLIWFDNSQPRHPNRHSKSGIQYITFVQRGKCIER
jgi:hypothetical protein